MNLSLEIKEIEKFIVKDKQTRYIQFVSSKINRRKFIRDLPHFRYFEWDKFKKVQGNKNEIINSTLQKLKIDTSHCYIISANRKLDMMVLDTQNALEETIGYGMATILVFGDADLVFYEDEGPSNRFISKL